MAIGLSIVREKNIVNCVRLTLKLRVSRIPKSKTGPYSVIHNYETDLNGDSFLFCIIIFFVDLQMSRVAMVRVHDQ